MRVVISTIEAAMKKGYRTYSGDGIHSSFMIAPIKATPSTAERFLKMKIRMIVKGQIRSSEDELKRFC